MKYEGMSYKLEVMSNQLESLENLEKTNTRKNYDLAFHMQGLLFLSKNKPLNYKIKKDKFLTEFI